MTRYLLILFMLLTLTLIPTEAKAASEWRWDECRMNAGSSTWTSREVRQTIRCAVTKWSVPGGLTTAISIALCESGVDLQDWYIGDGYAGTMQQSVIYWRDRRQHYRPPGWKLQRSPAQPRANVIVSIRMAHGSGWSAWSCA